MFVIRTHVYLKIKLDKVWAKQLEGQTVVELQANEPFSTENLLIKTLDPALLVAKAAIKQVNLGKMRWVSPKIVIHPIKHRERELDPVEEQLLDELAASLNALDVRIWKGRELIDAEVVALFKSQTGDQS